jgi:hypothetical protein
MSIQWEIDHIAKYSQPLTEQLFYDEIKNKLTGKLTYYTKESKEGKIMLLEIATFLPDYILEHNGRCAFILFQSIDRPIKDHEITTYKNTVSLYNDQINIFIYQAIAPVNSRQIKAFVTLINEHMGNNNVFDGVIVKFENGNIQYYY